MSASKRESIDRPSCDGTAWARALAALLCGACLVATGCGGCQNGGDGPADMGGVDASDASGADIPEVICEPGEVRSCKQENTQSIEVCNDSGTEYVSGSCGDKRVCRDGACVDVFCLPGTRRCDDETHVQECNTAGDAFEDVETCSNGSRCTGGICLNRCEIAEETSSYIGCEYWAAELENHLLYNDLDSPVPENERPPFAVVLANTSRDYDARVTVYAGPDEVAEVITSRPVGTDRPIPGMEKVTVYSELVGPNGQRLGEPIEGEARNLPLPRGSMLTLILPNRDIPFGETSLTPNAYKVVSSEPVVAYQFNPLCCNYNYTNDASLLLPKGALTENYMFMSYAVFAGSAARLEEPWAATMSVMATEPDTEVTVRLRGSRREGRPYSELIYDPTDPRIVGPGDSGLLRVTLQPFEVFNIGGRGADPVEDLTGARITATAPIAVFGGHSCTFVPFTSPACDHLEQQLFPLETWGQRFVASPLKTRLDRDEQNPGPTREGTYWKILAREDGTIVETGLELSPPNVLRQAGEGVSFCGDLASDPATGKFLLDAGDSCEFGTRDEAFVVTGSQPIMVGAFLSSQNTVDPNAQFGDHAGDPAFFLVPPSEQYRTDYAFLTPATYFESYVTVTMAPGFSVILDGRPIDLSELDTYREYPELNVARAHIEVEAGPHTISSPVTFGIVVYGYDDYVSYAYTGGLDLTKISTLD